MTPARIATDFNPLEDLFVAQFARPVDLNHVNLRVLSPFLRALLAIDGTVTKFIEAFTMEPIDVTLLSQDVRHLGAENEWLEAPAGTAVIAREVVLTGRNQGKVYAYAPSLLVVDRLPASVQAELVSNPGGLGKILLASRVESRREILWYGRERLERIPDGIPGLRAGDFISRTYRIISGERPVMLINEKFPTDSDPFPTHD
jgi:chorismate-pyruvate lyase